MTNRLIKIFYAVSIIFISSCSTGYKAPGGIPTAKIGFSNINGYLWIHKDNTQCKSRASLGNLKKGEFTSIEADKLVTLTTRYKALANSINYLTTFTFEPEAGKNYYIKKGESCNNDCLSITITSDSKSVNYRLRDFDHRTKECTKLKN